MHRLKGRKELHENASSDHASAIMSDFTPFLYFLKVLQCSLIAEINLLFHFERYSIEIL